MRGFKLGDPVTWTSQAAGFEKTKTGTIVAVVPPMGNPRHLVPEGMSLDASGLHREHESYLVRVGNSKRLYWPVVKRLAKAAKGKA